jgi:hypothetical protein
LALVSKTRLLLYTARKLARDYAEILKESDVSFVA